MGLVEGETLIKNATGLEQKSAAAFIRCRPFLLLKRTQKA